jgi:hypothetical protein
METDSVPRAAPRKAGRTGLIIGLCAAVAILVGGIALGVSVSRRPDPVTVQNSFRTYIESTAIAGKIVLVESKERLVISQTTPGFLFGDNAFGRFLGIRSDATIEASAWADVAYVIDLYANEPWSSRYDPADGGSISVAAPPLAMLTPAIHTDTIEIKTIDASILLDERKLEAAALRGLTERFIEAASKRLGDQELRATAAKAIDAVVRAFAAESGIPLERVDVAFAPPED